jgi:hypothetical protein
LNLFKNGEQLNP